MLYCWDGLVTRWSFTQRIARLPALWWLLQKGGTITFADSLVKSGLVKAENQILSMSVSTL